MKTEFLKALGLTDEQISDIMKENGKDIEGVKSKFSDYETLKTQLGEANTAINGFKDMDIDGIKQAADDWKIKAETAEKDKNAYIHKSKVQGYVKGLGLKDDVYESHLTNILLEKGLQFEGDTLIGGDDIIKPFRESHADAFLSEKPVPKVVGATPGATDTALTKEALSSMSYTDRAKFKQEHPDTYQTLKE